MAAEGVGVTPLLPISQVGDFAVAIPWGVWVVIRDQFMCSCNPLAGTAWKVGVAELIDLAIDQKP